MLITEIFLQKLVFEEILEDVALKPTELKH